MFLCCRLLVFASLLATIVSAVRAFPHQISYFNEIAGGPENGHKHLLGSSFDWGQDCLYLRDWQLDRLKVDPTLTFCIVSAATYDPADLGLLGEFDGDCCPEGEGVNRVSFRRVAVSKALSEQWLAGLASNCAHRAAATSCEIGYTQVVFIVASAE